MPFIPNHVRLEHSTGREFRVMEDLAYLVPGGRRHVIHAGLTTDMASIPPALWSVIAPFGEQSLPAILHDQECTDLRKLARQRTRERRRQRQAIDNRFRDALLERGVPRFRAVMMWTGASVGRYWEHGGILLRLALFLQLAVGYAAIVWGIVQVSVGEEMGWVLLTAPALAALAWGRSSAVVFLAQYPGLGILAMGVAAFTFALLDWTVNLVFGARLLEPSPEEEERLRPTREWKKRESRERRPFRGVGAPPGLRILPY